MREFKHLVYFHHAAVLRHLNQVFLCPTSPSWFISVFGHTEGQVLLTMAYYLFEGQYSTISTVEEYVRSFCTRDLGTIIPTHASMGEFARLLLGSPFRQRVSAFVAYAVARNRRDYTELEQVDTQINAFRERARLPDTVCVHYVYLAYRTALARARLLEYRRVVAYDADAAPEAQCTREPGFLGRRLSTELLDVMQKYFSLDNFLHDYVETHLLRLDESPTRRPARTAWGWPATAAASTARTWRASSAPPRSWRASSNASTRFPSLSSRRWNAPCPACYVYAPRCARPRPTPPAR